MVLSTGARLSAVRWLKDQDDDTPNSIPAVAPVKAEGGHPARLEAVSTTPR
jgi:hypothetical protein